MVVTVPLNIEINPGRWTMAYGIDDPEAIREDVRRYVLNILHGLASVESGVQSVQLIVPSAEGEVFREEGLDSG